MVTKEMRVLLDAANIIGDHADLIRCELAATIDPDEARFLRGLIDSVPRAMLLIGWVTGDLSRRQKDAPFEPAK